MTAPVLVTIPYSHFCEKARWALDWHGVAYREEGHPPLMCRLALARRGVWHSVPVLFDGGAGVPDSTAIIRHLDARADPSRRLFTGDPEVEALEADFDANLGPHARRVAYALVLDEDAIVRDLLGRGVSNMEATLSRRGFKLIRNAIVRGLRITPDGLGRSRTKVETTLAQVSARLADGRRFLTGDRFTAADLAFASLLAPLIFPPRFGGPFVRYDDLPPPIRAEVDRVRETVAGRFALHLFDEFRDGPVPLRTTG